MIPNIRRDQKLFEVIPEDDFWNQVRDYQLAKTVGDVLYRHYPNYHWWIYADTKDAVILIKCGEINATISSGLLPSMVIDYNKSQDDSTLVKKIVRAGGELLERANLKRGAFNGEYPTKVDGVPEKQQPNNGSLFDPKYFTGLKCH